MKIQFTPRLIWRLLVVFVAIGAYAVVVVVPKKAQVGKPVEVSKEAVATEAGEIEEEPSAVSSQPSANEQTARVVRVIDGDTIELEGGVKVRYIGVDTPETVHPDKPVQCFGQEAKEENVRLVENKTVRLEKDVSDTDRYGRLLRYVYVDTVMVNDALVRQGFAHAATFPPDVRYQEQFLAAEKEAREADRGLWGGCPAERDPAPRDTSTLCMIKGNISSSGEKIYHVPGCSYFEKTVIDETAGEKWFCSEQEAQAAGWRKAKNCP